VAASQMVFQAVHPCCILQAGAETQQPEFKSSRASRRIPRLFLCSGLSTSPLPGYQMLCSARSAAAATSHWRSVPFDILAALHAVACLALYAWCTGCHPQQSRGCTSVWAPGQAGRVCHSLARPALCMSRSEVIVLCPNPSKLQL
jgi:hypothetical protein